MEAKAQRKRVIVDVNGEKLTIGVMQGKQTFKWLALVLQTRIKEMMQGKGGARVAKSDTQGALVTGLMNSNNELLDPRDHIYEHAVWYNDEWTIRATTSGSFPSDTWGNPVYNDWTMAAYLNSEDSYRFMLEMDAWRIRLEPGIDATNSSGTGGSKGGSHLIQIGEAPDIETAFELDWSAMSWKWLPSLTELQKGSLRNALQERYAVILALFRHYCGAGELGQRYGMTTTEFSHLVHLALHVKPLTAQEKQGQEQEQGQGQPEEVNAADSKAGASATGGGGGGSIGADSTAAPDAAILAESKTDGQIAEASTAKGSDDKAVPEDGDAIEARLHQAYEKTSPSSSSASASASADADADAAGGGSARGGRSEIATSPMKARAAAAPKSMYNRTKSDARWALMSRAHMAQSLMCMAVDGAQQTGESAQMAICKLFDGPLTSLWNSIVHSYTMYRNMHDHTFVEAFVNTYAVLKQAFLTFGSTHPLHGPRMTAEKCVWLFKNSLFVGSSMLEKEQEGAVVSAFLDSHLCGSTVGATGPYASTSGSIEFPHLVFSEFLEVLASVALVSERDSGMEVGKKMRLAFNTIAQLQPPPEAKNDNDNESKK